MAKFFWKYKGMMGYWQHAHKTKTMPAGLSEHMPGDCAIFDRAAFSLLCITEVVKLASKENIFLRTS
jgi:hypothetical protein